MTVNKLTNNVKPLDEVDKINEIIDELDNIDPLPSQTGQSGKYLTTNGTVPSWADVQSLPSQTGKAGLYLQTDGTDASWEGVPGRNIGEIVASTIPLTDAGLHLLDGALIQGSGIYSAFVDYIAGLDLTANYFCTEQEWQASVTQYGVCGKFVYNSTNNTVRLPKYSNKIYTQDISSSAPVVGNGISLGLTNGTSNGALCGYSGSQVNAALTVVGEYGKSVATSYTFDSVLQGRLGVTTDGTKSGIIAQLSDITTSLDGYYYIVIATSTKTDIQVDIDEITTDLNGKADVDFQNCTFTPMRSDVVHIVETYVNGTSWYRVYSDGWCEQGGRVFSSDSTVSLLKAYKNTNYNVLITEIREAYADCYNGGAKPLTTSSFKFALLYTGNGYYQGGMWQACGYIN